MINQSCFSSISSVVADVEATVNEVDTGDWGGGGVGGWEVQNFACFSFDTLAKTPTGVTSPSIVTFFAA